MRSKFECLVAPISSRAALPPAATAWSPPLVDGNDLFKITEGPGKTTTIPRDQIQSLTPSPTSLMPEGLKALGDEKLNDLLEFLTGEQPK